MTNDHATKLQKRQAVAVCAFLVALVFGVFGQTAGFKFINFDDQTYIYENPTVQQGLTLRGVKWALTYGKIGHWHPLTWITHMLDCQVYGLWAGGHHLTNVALHALTAVFLFLTLRAMTGATRRSAIVAAVFAIHPLRAESVAWISERKDVLSGLFFILTLWSYVKYARQPSRKRYAVVFLFCLLGLLSKNMLVTLPFVLLLLDWWPLGRMNFAAGLSWRDPMFWKLVREKVPLFLLSIGSCIATALVPEKVDIAARVSVSGRIANALVSYLVYLRQFFVPRHLAIPYSFPPRGTSGAEACLAILVLSSITAGAYLYRRKWPYLLIGWLWYLGMLVPAIGFIQISYYSHADRYTYLPEIGIAIAVVWGLAEWSASWKHRTAVWVSGGMVGLVTLMDSTYIQTSYWRENTVLWTHVLECEPANDIAHYCLALALYDNGKTDEAIAHYKKLLEIKPDYAEAWGNLGVALYTKGKTVEAIADYRKALQYQPGYPEAWGNLGVALFGTGVKEEAVADYRKAIELGPDYPAAWANLGVALFDKGEKAQAIADYGKALEIDPRYVKAEYNWANALAAGGDFDGATAHFQKALKLKPDYAAAQDGLGAVLSAKQQWDEAITQYRKALDLDPSLGDARRGLGRALLAKGDCEKAMECFSEIASVNRDFSTRWQRLGDQYLQTNDLVGALLCYRQVLKINPRSAPAYADSGMAFFGAGDARNAIGAWEKALDIEPAQPNLQNNLAWLLATTPDPSLRDGAKAVALAEEANRVDRGKNPVVLHTLAAAYAEAGRYEEAKTTARLALAGAGAQNDRELAGKLMREIALYQSNAPWRDIPQ